MHKKRVPLNITDLVAHHENLQFKSLKWWSLTQAVLQGEVQL